MKLSRFYLRFFTRHSTRRQLVTLFICAVLIPVSYTHLDVYKRQT